MKRGLKITMWAVVVPFVGLVAFANAIPLIIGEGNCQRPLSVVVLITEPKNYSPVLTQSDFQKMVEGAITEWETKTGMDLFVVVDQNSTLARSGLVNTITAIHPDLEKFSLDNTKAGWTNAETRGVRVEKFEIEIYNLNPTLIYEIILHELGHARGLHEHSLDPNDVMFKEANPLTTNLSAHDVQTMVSYCNGK